MTRSDAMRSLVRPSLLATALALAVSAFAATARADGVLTAKSALTANARTSLQSEIAQARGKQAAAFAAVRKVDSFKKSTAMRFRNDKPTAVRDFRSIGPAGLFPLLELAAFDAQRGSLDDDEWRTLGEGVLQALAVLKSDKASPVFEATFLGSKEASWVEYAADGLGELCGDAQVKLLFASLDAKNPRRKAAAAGLRYCQRTEVAEKMVTLLDDPDPTLRAIAARSLGYVGSSWGLAANKSIPADEAEHIRSLASDALLDHYTNAAPAVRAVIYRAVLMVEHPTADARITDLKRGAPSAVRQELDRLGKRLALNRARAKH
jgi:hypothetical protein